MDEFTNLTNILLKIQNQNGNHSEQSFNRDEYLASRVDSYNKIPGSKNLVDCDICLNRGHIAVIREGDMRMLECKCMETRNTLKRIEKSGLSQLLDKCTFDSFNTDYEWQRNARAKAEMFLQNYQEHWFYAGGQVGSGKTHLCTAIVGTLLKQGKSARYMLWRDEIVPLKAMVTDGDEYTKVIDELKTVDVLYIDDFFKTERGKSPTTADINVAFELLNYRYINSKLVTIISSERMINDVLAIDEAVGSRIYQRSKNYCIGIDYDKAKNYRLK